MDAFEAGEESYVPDPNAANLRARTCTIATITYYIINSYGIDPFARAVSVRPGRGAGIRRIAADTARGVTG